jgi:hypothetical protein
MNFALYGKKRIQTPTPNQLFLLRQREKQLKMYLLSKNNTSEHVKCESEHENKIVENESEDEKEVIVYELGLDVDSLEIPEPKLEEPMIQELSDPSAYEEAKQ